jgi:hypothetical protein
MNLLKEVDMTSWMEPKVRIFTDAAITTESKAVNLCKSLYNLAKYDFMNIQYCTKDFTHTDVFNRSFDIIKETLNRALEEINTILTQKKRQALPSNIVLYKKGKTPCGVNRYILIKDLLKSYQKPIAAMFNDDWLVCYPNDTNAQQVIQRYDEWEVKFHNENNTLYDMLTDITEALWFIDDFEGAKKVLLNMIPNTITYTYDHILTMSRTSGCNPCYTAMIIENYENAIDFIWNHHKHTNKLSRHFMFYWIERYAHDLCIEMWKEAWVWVEEWM